VNIILSHKIANLANGMRRLHNAVVLFTVRR